MSMKITKKILAGTLALMNAFTAVSAEPVKVEKPTDSFISTKEDKKPNRESTKKKLAKGAAIAAGGVAVVAAATGGAIALIRNIFKTREIEENLNPLPSSSGVLDCYLLLKLRSNSEIEELFEKYKETDFVKALTYLIGVLDGNESVDKGRVIESLRYVGSCTSVIGYESKYYKLLYKGTACYIVNYLAPDKTLIDNSGFDSSLLGDPGIHFILGFGDFSKSDKEKIMKFNFSCSSYNLEAIGVRGEEDCCFDTAYMKHEDGKWHRHSFDGIKEEPFDDDSMMSKLKKFGPEVRLFYVKSNEQPS